MSERAGFVALTGWTNVGKSTLLNRLVGFDLAAVGSSPHTTRRRLIGVRTIPGRGQIAFIDTPGLHDPEHRMNRTMVDAARRAVSDADLVLLVVDAARGIGRGDRRAADLVTRVARDRIAVLNKIDRLRPRAALLPLMSELRDLGWNEIVPLSAATGEGVEGLIDLLAGRLPEGPAPYPDDSLTDQPQRVLAAEWIRERLLGALRQELPQATAVVVDRWLDQPGGRIDIDASILVERDSQKKIVIGQGGTRLRDVGTAARLSIQERLGQPVVLRLVVRTRRDWRDDERVLRELDLA